MRGVSDDNGRFVSGSSGNPGGRPAGIAARVREAVDVEGVIRILIEIALDPEARAADRIRATSELLDRGWGKAPQFAPVDSGDDDPLERSEIDAAILAVVEELRGTYTPTPEQN